MRPFILTGVLLVALSVTAQATAEPARHGVKAPVLSAKKSYFPSGPCDFEHRLDLEIIDGVWFECVCSALVNGWDCAWYDVGEAAVASRKPIKRAKKLPAKKLRLVVRPVVA